MTKKKQQEIAKHAQFAKDTIFANKLTYLDMISAINDLITVASTDEVLYLDKEEPPEVVVIPQTEEEREEVINDIIKEKGDLA